MSASNAFEQALLAHLLTNAAIANIGNAAGLPASSAAGSLYVALHTADPGEAGSQSTSEATYTGYSRVAVARSSAGWTVTAGGFANAADVTFGKCTGGTNTITHFSIGTLATGAGMILFSAAVATPLAVSAPITPNFAAGDLTGTVD